MERIRELLASISTMTLATADLQGNLSQAHRERNLAAFGAGE